MSERPTGAKAGTPARGSPGWWDERYAETDLMWSAGPNLFVVEELEPAAPGTALDLACGEGRNAVWLAERGWQVTGVDFSAVALDRARAIAARRHVTVTWVKADALSWQPDQTYDLVLLAYLQLREPERQQALTIAATTTAPGGSVLVIAHDLRNLTDGTGGPQYPELLWTPDEVARPGFTVARAQTAARPVGEATAWDTVVRLVRDR